MLPVWPEKKKKKIHRPEDSEMIWCVPNVKKKKDYPLAPSPNASTSENSDVFMCMWISCMGIWCQVKGTCWKSISLTRGGEVTLRARGPCCRRSLLIEELWGWAGARQGEVGVCVGTKRRESRGQRVSPPSSNRHLHMSATNQIKYFYSFPVFSLGFLVAQLIMPTSLLFLHPKNN